MAMTQNGTDLAVRQRRSGLFAHAREKESFSLSGILTLKRREQFATHCPLSGCQFREQSARESIGRPIDTRDLCRVDGTGVRVMSTCIALTGRGCGLDSKWSRIYDVACKHRRFPTVVLGTSSLMFFFLFSFFFIFILEQIFLTVHSILVIVRSRSGVKRERPATLGFLSALRACYADEFTFSEPGLGFSFVVSRSIVLVALDTRSIERLLQSPRTRGGH